MSPAGGRRGVNIRSDRGQLKVTWQVWFRRSGDHVQERLEGGEEEVTRVGRAGTSAVSVTAVGW